MKTIEKDCSGNVNEIRNYRIIGDCTIIPRIFNIDDERKIITMEDLTDDYIKGSQYDGDYRVILDAAVKFHAGFWDNYDVFGKIGLDWRLENKNNLLIHINAMEAEGGNHEYYRIAAGMLREKYPELLETRFHKGKNITVIHGDLHPGNTFVSKSSDKTVKFIDMEAVRMGLCTEDLAMFVALHIEPDKKKAMPLLEYYYTKLTEFVNDYTFDTFMNDYKISVMESMFFPLHLINTRGINDFTMRDRGLKAFETFVLDMQ